ncbi:MAG TPA: hypothetical protein VHR18_03025 [Solirubrobacterales bacterium]|nr:hypothetical protein [Solirubrobacterales bacterium]
MKARLARLRFALLGAGLLALLLASQAAGATAGDDGGAAAKRLAARHAPITMLREQQHPPCETDTEQYEPTSVDTVLGNPDVALERARPDGKLEEVERGPSAGDIAGLADGYYMDLEGKVLDDTCVYARDFKALLEEGKAAPTTYAHVAREADRSGFALQYWFFWYFNQFNDLHEGDWEGMQLSFEAETPREALARGEEPSEIILFQHAGGERAGWEDSKVRKEGTHPIVYPAAGSHATFYDSAVYVENGQEGSGLGCDNTSEPLRELRPRPVLLPAEAPLEGKFAWLSYEGRWGEREKGYNNGPTGPATKTVWREPFTWMEAQRSTSPRLPGGSIVGPQVTGAFCDVVASASELINLDAKSRPAAVATIAALLLVIGLFVGFTKWGPVDLKELRARRSFGQMLRTARQLYGRHWRVLVPVALTAIPVVGGVNLLAGELNGGGGIDSAAGRSGFNLALADLVETIIRPAAQAVVAAVVVVLVRELVAGRESGFAESWRGMGARFWRVVGAQLLATLGIIALAVTVVGLPFAIYKLVGWRFVQQEVLFEDKRFRDAFRGSSAIVRGRWWHSVRLVLFLAIFSVVVGPVASFALIFTTLPLFWANLLGALVFSLMIPYVALGDTLLYFDLKERAQTEGIKPARSWKLWRPRQFGRPVREAPGSPQAAASG